MAAGNPASARRWGWAILLLTSSISLAFNIGHALTEAAAHSVAVPLAVLYGVAPVLVAMMLSHLIAIQQGGRLKRALTGVVFIAAMALSVRAIYEVLEPIAGRWGMIFAAMLDLASLLALNEVLASTSAATATSPATSPATVGAGSGGPERSGPPHRHAPGPQRVRQTATTPASSGRQKAASAAPRTRTGGAPVPSGTATVAASAPARQTPASTPAADPASKNGAVPPTARSSHSATARTAKPLTTGDTGSTGSSGGAQPPQEAPSASATGPATPGAEPSRLAAPPHRHTATTEEAATPSPHIGAATTDRHNIRDLSADWRTLLTDDVAAAATAFVLHRDAQGAPRRGAGTEFAELARQHGSDLSMRQLRDYITKACKQIDQHT
ncbi:hypothetical protein [Actinomadura sp. NPDC048394]|uniref:hypothetical protein n=1 Tax=Actinomadura sp. NPDC048394 TaxID=3158223 RepID=UPI0033DA20A1